MDLTIHEIPEALDEVLQAKAKASGKSVNEIAIEALYQVAGIEAPPTVHHDLDWFFGGNCIDDQSLKAIEQADVVHSDDWK
jgi:hypothetical protein